ncbi:hypothetical protein RYX36_015426, partial [Vicia faba]
MSNNFLIYASFKINPALQKTLNCLFFNHLLHTYVTHAFKHETERLVTELKNSAQYVEDKLDSIEEKSDCLLQNSKQISESLESVNSHT